MLPAPAVRMLIDCARRRWSVAMVKPRCPRKTEAKNHRRFNGKIIIPRSPWGSQAEPAPDLHAQVWTAVEPLAQFLPAERRAVRGTELDCTAGVALNQNYARGHEALSALKGSFVRE